MQHGGRLIGGEIVEFDDRAIRQFQRIVVRMRLVLIDLTEDADIRFVRGSSGIEMPIGLDRLIEGDLRPRKDADGYILAVNRAEAASAGSEVANFEFVVNRSLAGGNLLKRIIADGSLL